MNPYEFGYVIGEKTARCWAGYEPVPGTKSYTEGSCRPVGSKKTKKEVIQGKKHQDKEAGMLGDAASYVYNNPGTVAWEGAKWLPGVGAIPSLVDAGSSAMAGNWGDAAGHALGAAGSLVIPGGGAYAKGLTAAGKGLASWGARQATKGVFGSGIASTAGKGVQALGSLTQRGVTQVGKMNTNLAKNLTSVMPTVPGQNVVSRGMNYLGGAAGRNPILTASMFAAPGESQPAQPPMDNNMPMQQPMGQPQMGQQPMQNRPVQGFSNTGKPIVYKY